MESNEIIRNQIFEIIKNQMKDNKPPETNNTFKRLLKKNSRSEAKQLIGQCVAVELFGIFKFGKPFDEKRYIKNLNNLPEEPFE